VAVQADIGERLAYRADRNVIERAARALRDYAIRDGYSGSEQPARAFSLALLVDELGRHVRDLDDELRAVVVQAGRDAVGRGRLT
jgi:hypothetical protein